MKGALIAILIISSALFANGQVVRCQLPFASSFIGLGFSNNTDVKSKSKYWGAQLGELSYTQKNKWSLGIFRSYREEWFRNNISRKHLTYISKRDDLAIRGTSLTESLTFPHNGLGSGIESMNVSLAFYKNFWRPNIDFDLGVGIRVYSSRKSWQYSRVYFIDDKFFLFNLKQKRKPQVFLDFKTHLRVSPHIELTAHLRYTIVNVSSTIDAKRLTGLKHNTPTYFYEFASVAHGVQTGLGIHYYLDLSTRKESVKTSLNRTIHWLRYGY